MKYITTVDNETFTLDIDEKGVIMVNGKPVDADMQRALEPTLYSLILSGKSNDVRIEPKEDYYQVQVGGESFEVVVQDDRTHRLAGIKAKLGGGAGEAAIKAPMPGVVVETPVAEGDEVKQGQTVIVLESMKMHNEFKSPKDGTVHAMRVAKGDKVDKNALLLTIS